MSPCLTLACQLAEAHLSTSPDPFAQTCDHFLSTCRTRSSHKSRGRQRGQGIPGHPQNRMEKSAWPETESEETINRRPVEDKILSRKSALLQNLRKILGKMVTSGLNIYFICVDGKISVLCVFTWDEPTPHKNKHTGFGKPMIQYLFSVSRLENNNGSNSSAVQKTRDFYHSCMDTRSIETTGAEPFLKLIQAVPFDLNEHFYGLKFPKLVVKGFLSYRILMVA